MHEFELAIDSDGGLFSHLVGDERSAGGRTPCSSANMSVHTLQVQDPPLKRAVFVADKGHFQLGLCLREYRVDVGRTGIPRRGLLFCRRCDSVLLLESWDYKMHL